MTATARLLIPACILATLFTAFGAQKSSPKKPAAQPRYTISGYIGGLVPHRAMVKATDPGKPSHSASTRSDGTFTLQSVLPGTYDIRPSHASYSFAPTFHTVAVTNHDVHNINFTAHAHPSKKK